MSQHPPHPIPAAALDRATAFVGTTGSGKTFTAKGAAELLLAANRRLCTIDPTVVWWGLKTSADGLRPGFPVVVFGGEHADVPIAVDSGARLGSLIAGGSVRASIVDVSEFTGGEANTFLTAFAEALYAENREALHLIVDEADALAPQNPMPEGRRLLGAIDKIARRGRVKGFRLWSITQRPAVLHKNVLSQISTLVAMRLGSPQDRKAIEAWVQGNADAVEARRVLDSLPKLDVGQGWVWCPGENVLELARFPRIKTFDSSRTPEPGEEVIEARSFAAVDVGALAASLAGPKPDREDEHEEEHAGGGHGRQRRAGVGQRPTARAAQVDLEQRGYDRGFAEGKRAGIALAIGELHRSTAVLARHISGDASRDEPLSAAERAKRYRERRRAASRENGTADVTLAAKPARARRGA